MRVFTSGKWQDGFLDYHRGSDEYRIAVKEWQDLKRIHGLYFVRPKSLRLVLSYVKEVGLRLTVRKILSRLGEGYRNEKYAARGLGVILESADPGRFPVGSLVRFSASVTPRAERIVVRENEIARAEEPSAVSGGLSGQSAVQEVRKGTAPPGSKKTAVLFGYGHYAKVNIIPNIKKRLFLQCIHEIDPTQIPRKSSDKITWDTSPVFRQSEKYDAAFIAGYHHTHAPLAIAALERGMDVVVEKPVVTEELDLQKLLEVAGKSKSRVFASFHKRHSPFNDFVFSDLGIKRGEPFHYHCLVYEAALPKLHWYRWPESKSRLFADGCHWVDHFLFLNNFGWPKSIKVDPGPNGAVNCSIRLENGSYFTMVLTTLGSGRVGVRDYIEMRAGEATVSVRDGAEYTAENGERIVRKKRINKTKCYKEMYCDFANRIAEGGDGDTLGSIRILSEVMFGLEAELKKVIR